MRFSKCWIFEAKLNAETEPCNYHNRYLRSNSEASKKNEDNVHLANLNYVRFNRYLQEFLSKGFIEALKDAEGNGCYRITPRGKELCLGLLKESE